MTRLIDAEAKGLLMELFTYRRYTGIDEAPIETAIDVIHQAPTIDAVEVVRCKDCIRTMERDEYTGLLWCSLHRGYMEDTFYCADGLRRGDGE